MPCDRMQSVRGDWARPYGTPNVIKMVDELPQGPSGKVQRLKLLEI
jgi:acyl-coenzyme A synthetase/AMP-(fatty) acid ligase